ncbi:hypothetical protein HAX54_042161 [Datura stramonium]|uniref:Pentatricopeptide repeat-containing protein n=1 Tax=Datura stramonium TaxID=4076 RepID=A0ABS8SM71_DATST|nr:hypothetical protein [Datura stramonium]
MSFTVPTTQGSSQLLFFSETPLPNSYSNHSPGLSQQNCIVLKIVNFFAYHTPINSSSYASLVIKQSHNSSNSWWNILIKNYATGNNCSHSEAIRLFVEMRRFRAASDEFTYPFLFKACSSFLGLKEGKQIHGDAIKIGICNNVYVQNTLIHFYGSCKKIVDAYKTTMVLLSACAELGDLSLGNGFIVMIEQGMFDYERNVWTWSAMILGLAQHGFVAQALELFWKMKDCSVRPNYVSFLGVLCACSHVGMVEEGHRLFQEMESVHRIKPMMAHYGAMVDILSRAGRLKEAA